MDINPRISVLVPTYNRAGLLPQCLASLFAQTLPPSEIIVIDDGSEDGTPELLRSYGRRIRPIRKSNGGKSTALNVGLDAVRGDYVWVIDDDDVALPHALERMVAPLVVEPRVGHDLCWIYKSTNARRWHLGEAGKRESYTYSAGR